MNPSIERWIEEFFACIDRMDADGFAGHFADDGAFRFANQGPLVGRAPIAAGAGAIFGMLEAIRHEVIKHWLADGDLLVEGMVHYHRAADGRRFAFPFLSVFEFENTAPGPIQAYRVFVDSHELFMPASA
ncbi:MAG: nuclear transport factor 2 family protein [Wenzhouxiangella sp.]